MKNGILVEIIMIIMLIGLSVLLTITVCSKEKIREAVQEIKQDIKYFWSDADTFYTEWQEFDSIQYAVDTGLIYTHTVWLNNKPMSFFDSCRVARKIIRDLP